MNPGADQLRSTVFGCEHCSQIPAFSRPADGGPFHKFPPIIGAQGPAPLLFVGINPRRSDTNVDLHNWLMQSSRTFARLARNRLQNRQPYIAVNGEEEHYRCHAVVLEGVFGVGTPFESKAAVTELYLCASKAGSKLLGQGKSECAKRHLAHVINIVKPTVIVAVGRLVQDHLSEHFSDIIGCHRVRMEHPRFLYGLSHTQRKERLKPTIEEIAKLLKK